MKRYKTSRNNIKNRTIKNRRLNPVYSNPNLNSNPNYVNKHMRRLNKTFRRIFKTKYR